MGNISIMCSIRVRSGDSEGDIHKSLHNRATGVPVFMFGDVNINSPHAWANTLSITEPPFLK